MDTALLGGIHILSFTALQENHLDLLVEEFLCLRIPRVQAVVVDEEGLVLEPLGPAALTDFTVNPFSEIVPKGRLRQPGGVFFATNALNRFH